MTLRHSAAVIALVLLGLFAASDAQASKLRYRHHRAVVFVNRDASIVVDADTGKVLEANKQNEVRHPASLTKMMTLYLTFESLDNNKLHLSDRMPVSSYAAHQAPTNLDLMQGDSLTVEDAIKALVVRSANDAAVVLAEYMGGNESSFARRMTAKAHALGMKQTFYHNASGLPDARQITTARDLAVLGVALRKHFPGYYHYFNTREFVLNGVTYTTHNHVLQRYEWADGLKTGYIRMSGFNLVTSARRDGHSLVGVVLGGNTIRELDDKNKSLLEDSLARMGQGNTRSVAALVQVPGMGAIHEAKTEESVQEAAEEPSPAPSRQQEAYDPVYEATVAECDAVNPESTLRDWGIQVGLFGK